MRRCLRLLSAAIPKRGPYEATVEAGKRYSWCACGLSAKQPFCDGEHKKHPDAPKPVRIFPDAPATLSFCGCKQTKNPPYCDGSHNALPSTAGTRD